MSNIKLKLYENGKLKELQINWKVIAALLFPFTLLIKLIVKWFVIFTIAVQGLISDPAADGEPSLNM